MNESDDVTAAELAQKRLRGVPIYPPIVNRDPGDESDYQAPDATDYRQQAIDAAWQWERR